MSQAASTLCLPAPAAVCLLRSPAPRPFAHSPFSSWIGSHSSPSPSRSSRWSGDVHQSHLAASGWRGEGLPSSRACAQHYSYWWLPTLVLHADGLPLELGVAGALTVVGQGLLYSKMTVWDTGSLEDFESNKLLPNWLLPDIALLSLHTFI